MDAKKFDACKDKVRQSVIGEIDNLLTKEWDRLMASIGAVCDMDEAFPLAIAVVLTPHEGGIVHVAGLKYKCSREASGEPGFVRYDGTETVQGELFENAEALQEEVEDLADNEGWQDFDAFLTEARDTIMDQQAATPGVLMNGMTMTPLLADKTLMLLELQGFLGARNGDQPRDIVSLRSPVDPAAGADQSGQTTPANPDDPILASLIAKGYADKETFLAQAKEQVVETGRATITIIQRRLQVPFTIAQWAIDQLQERGIVTAPNGEGKREVNEQAPAGAAQEGSGNE